MPSLLGSLFHTLTGRGEEEESVVASATPVRRTMPARLGQVSSLLAGSALEEELALLTDSPRPSPAPVAPPRTIVLTSDTALIARATTRAAAQASLLSPEAVKRQKLIETPEFRPRDDSAHMPKTRGLRVAAADTSDAAYTRAHRRPEAGEKRQRKAEVEVLARDRAKLVQRIEQLRAVEARMLQPVLTAREHAHGTSARPLAEKLERIRGELLAEARETLQRYDFLLSSADRTASRSQSPRLTVTLQRRNTTPHTYASRGKRTTRTSLGERTRTRSPNDDGADSDSSISSYASSHASSLGYAFPTLAPTASLKVSPSLADTAALPDNEPAPPRSTRRATLQAFGEKLPDRLTRPAPFDYAVMHYLRHIDRPYPPPK